jgi:hypothetical protein
MRPGKGFVVHIDTIGGQGIFYDFPGLDIFHMSDKQTSVRID